MFKALFASAAAEGVLENVGNELAVSGSSSPLSIATGAALVDGFFVNSDAVESRSVTTPSSTTGGHVIVRLNWTTQTADIVVVLNTTGNTSPPALTQNDGTQWEIRLATFTITNTGVITLTDARSFAHFATRVSSTMIDTGAVTNDKIPDGAIQSVKLASPTNVSLTRRVGGSSGSWNTAGSNEYSISGARMFVGAASIFISSGSYQSYADVYFPTSYASKPLVFASLGSSVSSSDDGATVWVDPSTLSTTGCRIYVRRATLGSGSWTPTVHWWSVGQE